MEDKNKPVVVEPAKGFARTTSRTGEFRRNGVIFGREPAAFDSSKWTDEQKLAWLHTLESGELALCGPPKATKKGKVVAVEDDEDEVDDLEPPIPPPNPAHRPSEADKAKQAAAAAKK